MFNYFFEGEPEPFQFDMNNERNLYDTLKNHYPHIFEEVKKEEYIFDYPEYNILHELKFKDETVGFITFQKLHLTDNFFELTESYIIPKFRGKNILYKSLHQALINDNFDFLIKRPNIAFLKVLRKNNLTYKIDKDLYLSYIKFSLEIDEVFKNEYISRYFRKRYEEMPYKGNVFDFKLSSTLFVDPIKNFLKKDDIFVGTKPREYDLKKYDLKEKIEEVDEVYLSAMFLLWMCSSDEILDFQEKSERNILKSIEVKKILGTKKRLSKDFVNNLKEHGLSNGDGVKILNHVLDALEKDQLNNKSYIRRVNYLVENFDDVDKTVEEYSRFVKECPFCNMPIPDFVNSCMFCGLKIRELDFEAYGVLKHGGVKRLIKNIIKSKFRFLFRI